MGFVVFKIQEFCGYLMLKQKKLISEKTVCVCILTFVQKKIIILGISLEVIWEELTRKGKVIQ